MAVSFFHPKLQRKSPSLMYCSSRIRRKKGKRKPLQVESVEFSSALGCNLLESERPLYSDFHPVPAHHKQLSGTGSGTVVA